MSIQNRLPVLSALCGVALLSTVVYAQMLTLYIDGSDRVPTSTTRGKAGRAAWTAAVRARKGTILTDDFQNRKIDIPVNAVTSVGNFSVFFTQTGGYSKEAGNTAPDPHRTGVFVGTTGTGSANGKNEETIQGLELRYETLGPVTTALELRFDPPIFAWAADVYSVDGKGFGQGGGPTSNDHTTMQLRAHSFDFSEIFEYAGSGYNSFFGIISDTPFSSLSFTAKGDGDRWRLDNVSIAR